MIDFVSILIVLAAAFVGWGIGANSASNAVGSLAGLNMINFRTATLLVAVLMFAGALLQSGPVIKTIGEGIIPEKNIDNDRLAILSALLATAIFVGLLTTEALPVSSSHAVIGALVGSAVSMGIVKDMNFLLILEIIVAWFLTPVMSFILSILVYKFFISYMSKRITLVTFSETFRVLVIIGTAFVAYSLGANNAGNAAGLLISSGIGSETVILIGIGIAMGIGVVSFGGRVVKTVGRNITLIDPVTVFASQFAAGLTVYFFTLLGIPISASQAMIGGLVGVGASKGAGMVNGRLVTVIFVGWIITPIGSALLSMILYKALTILSGAF